MIKINRRGNTFWVSALNEITGKYMRLAGFTSRQLAEAYAEAIK